MFFVCVCVSTCVPRVCETLIETHTYRGLRTTFMSHSPPCGSRAPAQVCRLGSKRLYPLSNLGYALLAITESKFTTAWHLRGAQD